MAKETKKGADILAALQAKTGFEEREGRYGFFFELDGAVLGKPIRPDEPDYWTAKQRAEGIGLDFVTLSLGDERMADGRSAQLYARYGGTSATMPQVMGEQRILIAIHKVDGAVVPLDAVARDRLWSALGETGRELCAMQYLENAKPAEPTAEGEKTDNQRALERARSSFRVRV